MHVPDSSVHSHEETKGIDRQRRPARVPACCVRGAACACCRDPGYRPRRHYALIHRHCRWPPALATRNVEQTSLCARWSIIKLLPSSLRYLVYLRIFQCDVNTGFFLAFSQHLQIFKTIMLRNKSSTINDLSNQFIAKLSNAKHIMLKHGMHFSIEECVTKLFYLRIISRSNKASQPRKN